GHRLRSGEQHRLDRAGELVRALHAGTLAAGAFRYSGAKGDFWRSSTLPCRASSSAATKLEARADLRKMPCAVSGRQVSITLQSIRSPTRRDTRSSATSSVITGRLATICITGRVRALIRP